MWSCEKEEFDKQAASDQTTETPSPEVSYLRGKDARTTIKHLKTIYRESGAHHRGVVLDSAFFRWGYIDKNQVMQLTIRDNSTQTRTVNTTYRIKRYDDAPDNTFINLVLSENKYRTNLTLYGYVMSPEFADLYHHHGYPLTDFDGVVLTVKLDLSVDVKNCPNDVAAIKNWKEAQKQPGRTTLPPEYENPPQGGSDDFPGMLDDIAQPHGGGGHGGGGGSIPHLDMSWVADGVHWVGDLLGDIGHGFSDAMGWVGDTASDLWDSIFGCGCPGPNALSTEETDTSLELGGGGAGLVLIKEDHYNWNDPKNPYPDPTSLTNDRCHNLTVGVLSELFSTNFIAEALTADEEHKISVEDVELMYHHPEFLYPGMQFLETERFSHEAKLYFYAGFQIFKTNHLNGVTIHYQGFFINFYSEFAEDSAEYAWLVNDATKDQLDAIDEFFLETGDSEENVQQIKAIIDYLIDNPDTNWDDIENWVLGKSEGNDGGYDEQFWENPHQNFPQQNLPDWEDFKDGFPLKNDGSFMKSSEVYELVGGQIYSLYRNDPVGYANACAIRVSRGLNHSEISIPNIPGQTAKGADGKNYFLGAANLHKWMKETFGTPTGGNHLTGAQAGENGRNFPSLIEDKKGIYIIIPNYPGNNYFGASGHADLLENGRCAGYCYFNAKGGVYSIDIWELN